MSKAGAFARVLFGFAVTLALVVGIPMLLIAMAGNPLPSSIPSFDEIRILLTQNGDGFAEFVINGLAVLLWVIWAQLILALIVELVATLRRSETRALPTLPGIQSLAARLITSMTLATALATAPILPAAVGALTFDPIEAPQAGFHQHQGGLAGAALGLQVAEETERENDAIDAATATEPATELVLNETTEFWDLAEAAYGDGVAWKQIADANAGTADAQGVTMTTDTEMVPGGTQLVLPGAVDEAKVAAFGIVQVEVETEADPDTNGLVDPDAPDATLVVEQGDSMWSLAEEEVERRIGHDASESDIAPYWVDVVDANRDRVQSGDVDLIFPGEELVLPGAGGPDPASEQTPDAAPVSSLVDDYDDATDGLVVGGPAPIADANAPTPATSSRAARPYTAPESGQVPIRHLALATFGASFLASGIVGAIRRRRELQRRHRPDGSALAQPSSEAAAFEAALAHASDELHASQHGSGWRLLPADAVAVTETMGPMEVRANATGELMAVPLSDRIPPPGPSGRPGIDLRAQLVDTAPNSMGFEPVAPSAANQQPFGATTLVVGTDPKSGEAVLVDLIAAEAVQLLGEPTHVRRFVRTAVLDLAVSDRADDIGVIAVGIGHELADLERVHVVESFADALAHAVQRRAADPMIPVVVLGAAGVDISSASVAALGDLGAIIISPDIEAQVRITVSADQAKIWPQGSSVMLAALDDAEFEAVTELVESSELDAFEPVDKGLTVSEVLDVPVTAECPVAAGRVELTVLGPVEVVGASSFSSTKAIDVVCYLAFHRNGVDADQIKTWVWPAFDPPSDKAFANVMSRARTALGNGDDGEPLLSKAGSDRMYRLSPEVTTDFDRFRAIVTLADQAADTKQTLTTLMQALELIRGVPFTGGTSSSFAWADNHVRAHVEFTIDEIVHRCADLALELGDLRAARWAALKGLELVPGCEQCFRRRFLVAGAGNNRSELRRAMADLERTASIEMGEPEAVDTISGELLNLYHELDQALVAGPA